MPRNQLKTTPRIAVIGGGPAGLIAVEQLAASGMQVSVFDGKPSVLRKFLVAGKGGLNISRNEDFQLFLSHYGDRVENLKPFLKKFGPNELLKWFEELGFPPFLGSSGKVFPLGMQAVSVRKEWIKRLISIGVSFHLNQRWLGWNTNNELIFQAKDGNIINLQADATILALGGASWPKTGSDGLWAEILQSKGVKVAPFKPSNCGFNAQWSAIFRDRFQGKPVKSTILSFQPTVGAKMQRTGEFIITNYGVEGSLIYYFSALLREELHTHHAAVIHLDLMPNWTASQLQAKLSRPQGSRSLSSHLKKRIGLEGVKAGLVWEFLPRTVISNPEALSSAIKAIPVPLISPRPLEEAISTAGGIRFEDLSEDLMIKSLPGVFCAGEMLDWEAPTGGYLLTACFSTGKAAADGVKNWINQKNKR